MPASEIPPRTPLRTVRRAPVGYRRSLSTGVQQASPSRRLAVPPLARSHSQGRDIIDSSHLDGLFFEQQQLQQQQHQQRQRQRKERVVPSYPSQKVGIIDDCSDDSDSDAAVEKVEKPLPAHGEYSAEEIALRRFMTTVAWGPGLAVVKHNRGKGQGRRLLKFNDEVRHKKAGKRVVLALFQFVAHEQPRYVRQIHL